MKIFFEQNKNIPKLTLSECYNMLGEERHHTDFLDGIKASVTNFAIETVKSMFENGKDTYSAIFKEENRYFDELLMYITLNRRKDYSNKKYTHGQFYNEDRIENGKLHLPELGIVIGIGENGEIPTQWIELLVDHEINHLYDEWQWQSTGHEPLTNNKEWNFGDGKFIQENLGNNDNKFVQSLAWCVYASLWTESNAYLNQAFKEFETIKLKPSNIHQKLKTTTSYRNYSKQMIDLKWWLGKYSEDEVKEILSELFKEYKKLSIPKPKTGEDYRERLIKWSEWIYNRFIKRYCGIASLFIERNGKNFSR